MPFLKLLLRIIQKCFDFFGLNFFLLKSIPKHIEYEKIFTTATYAPWKTDAQFNDCFETIKSHTMVDKYRCFELWKLVAESSKLITGDLLEIGVWRGGSGALIAKKAMIEGLTEKVYLCDTFTGVIEAGKMDNAYRGGEHADTSKEIVQELLKKMKLNNVSILAGAFPSETGTLIANAKFRFCHIDVDVYNSSKSISEWIWPRLLPGGIIIYDDYGNQRCKGITKFINEEILKKDRIVIYNLNGHAVVIKLFST
jgi:O-methyltransferase